MRLALLVVPSLLLAGCALDAPAGDGAKFENAAPAGASHPECFRLKADKAVIAPGEDVIVASERECWDTKAPECGGPLAPPMLVRGNETFHLRSRGAAGPPSIHPAICGTQGYDPARWSWDGTLQGERAENGTTRLYGPEDAPAGTYRIGAERRITREDGRAETWAAWVELTVAPR